MLSDVELRQALPLALTRLEIPGAQPVATGKVRDSYLVGDQRVLVTTDRVSAFDRVIGAVPYKGQVLNQLSAWWFEQTRDLVENHLVAVPDPNVCIAANAAPLPVEVVVRGYITGVTSTALWTLYSQGVERPYGLDLPAGLRRNDPLPHPVITPTTKAEAGEHDQRLTCDEVIQRGLVAPELWREVQRIALALFARGQERAAAGGLILVDTKYEFGLLGDRLALIDEIHTPDSSRYWVAESYARVRGTDEEPLQLDKELLRRWLVEKGYRGDGAPPVLPPDLVVEVARRYIDAFERITGQGFEPGRQPVADRLRATLARLLAA